MQKTSCRRCGAGNDLGSPACWRCHASFGDQPAGSGYVPGAVVRAANTRAGSGTPPVGRPSSALSDAALWLRSALPTLLFVGALAFGGWWLWSTFLRGFPFPDEVAGVERIESDETEDVLGVIEEAGGGLAGLDWEFAAYGRGNRPTYALMAVPIDNDVEAASVMQFFGARQTGGSNLASSSFSCQPSFPTGSMCAWLEEDTLVVLAAEESDHRALRTVARDLRAEIDL